MGAESERFGGTDFEMCRGCHLYVSTDGGCQVSECVMGPYEYGEDPAREVKKQARKHKINQPIYRRK